MSTRYHVKHRASVTLECVVDSYPSHTEVTWYRVTNGGRTEVENGTDYCGSTVIVPSLTINRADLYDNGNYVCTAENVAGVGSSEATRVIVSGGKCFRTYRIHEFMPGLSKLSYNIFMSTSNLLLMLKQTWSDSQELALEF